MAAELPPHPMFLECWISKFASASSSCSVSSAMPHHLSPALPLPLHTPLALPILGVGCPANMSTSHCSVCFHVMPPSLFLSQVTSDVAGE
eukprot:459243-Hanusia_phi.AAC.2